VTRIAHYPQLVATVLLLRPGSRFPLVVTEGAVRPRVGANTIDLANDCVVLPAGARIEVRLGRGSGFSGSYLPYGHGTVTIGTVALRLRALNSPVSLSFTPRRYVPTGPPDGGDSLGADAEGSAFDARAE
jgi:hypothetical protein